MKGEKYFEYVRNENIDEFAKWLKELSEAEKERIKNLKYKNGILFSIPFFVSHLFS